MSSITGLLHGIMRVTSPHQLDSVRRGLDETSRRRLIVQDAIAQWPFPATHCQVIINRQTPFHRDTNSFPPWHDMIISLTEYCTPETAIALRTLGVTLESSPGSIAMILAFMIEHGVPEYDGNRHVIALFNRRDVVRDWTDELSAQHLMSNVYNIFSDAGYPI